MSAMNCVQKNPMPVVNHYEYLSRDILDEGFVKLFAPIRLIQKITGSCRVDIRDRFVTAPTVLQKCYTVICIIVSMYFTIRFVALYVLNFHASYNIQEKCFFECGVTLQNILFSIAVFQARFYNNEENVQFYINMQKIDNIMNLNDNNRTRRDQYKQNVGFVLLSVIFAGTQLIVFYSITFRQLALVDIFAPMWAFNAFIFEIISCTSYMVFFSKRVQLVNAIISDHFISKRRNADKSIEHEDFESSRTDLYMNEIFYCFDCLQNQYRFQVFLFCTMFLTWMVMGFIYAIFAIRSSVSMVRRVLIYKFKMLLALFADFSYICSMAFINVNFLLLLGKRSEEFFDQVKETKKLCIHILSRYIHEGHLRKKAKNMLKLIEDMPPSFSVYGMWRLNSRLVLDMFNILTGAYVIVMQFAFFK